MHLFCQCIIDTLLVVLKDAKDHGLEFFGLFGGEQRHCVHHKIVSRYNILNTYSTGENQYSSATRSLLFGQVRTDELVSQGLGDPHPAGGVEVQHAYQEILGLWAQFGLWREL